jgi:hypothetical protein
MDGMTAGKALRARRRHCSRLVWNGRLHSTSPRRPKAQREEYLPGPVNGAPKLLGPLHAPTVDAPRRDHSTPVLTLLSLALQTPANTCRAHFRHVTRRRPIGSCGVSVSKHEHAVASKAWGRDDGSLENTRGESHSRDTADPSFPSDPMRPPLIRGRSGSCLVMLAGEIAQPVLRVVVLSFLSLSSSSSPSHVPHSSH